MISVSYQTHKTVRKWRSQLARALPLFQLDPKLLTILCTTVIIFIQFIIYLAFSSQTIYCRLPNLRFYHRDGCNDETHKYLPTIYVITPTYARYVQKAELTRLSHTFMLVPNLHWIIVEDSEWNTHLVNKFILRLKREFSFYSITHLHAITPERFKLKHGQSPWTYPKGIWQRNQALEWIRKNLDDLDQNGVIYFADDDNTYDLELFNEMRYTEKISVWPVGLAGGMLVERPIVNGNTNTVDGFNSLWRSERPYPIDMAGFSISIQLFKNHLEAQFSSEQKIGYVESHFIGQLIQSWAELEPRAENCTKVLVWHTQAQKPNLHEERKLTKPSDSFVLEKR